MIPPEDLAVLCRMSRLVAHGRFGIRLNLAFKKLVSQDAKKIGRDLINRRQTSIVRQLVEANKMGL